jgi:Uma2 family endonuclease
VSSAFSNKPSAQAPDLVWEIASLYPPQGAWSDAGYLSLTASTNRLIEFTDGRVEFLSMPTKSHQLILMYLLEALRRFLQNGALGLALPAPLRVRVRPGKYREPDIVFVSAAHADRAGEEFYEGADLVMEIVSDDPERRQRDLVEKVVDYAEAMIPEYWIVDPQAEVFVVYCQPASATGYQQKRVFTRDDTAVSTLLTGFGVSVARTLHAART